MISPDLNAITTEQFSLQSADEKKIRTSILRLDRIHPHISGNKWFKLQYYLEEAVQLRKKRIVSFGGAWSNHLIATAAAAKLRGFESAGIIRGEKPSILNPVLMEAEAYGMRLFFTTREEFTRNYIPPGLDSEENYFIPAGGEGETGVRGAMTILDQVNGQDYTHIICAVGTGTMIAGLVRAAKKDQWVVGISVMKNNFQLDTTVELLAGNAEASWEIHHDFHFGGFAKYDNILLKYMNDLYRRENIPTDIVYTSKLCFATNELVIKGYFPAESRILVIHSGGLTGNASLQKGTLIF
jgi:1-aminocyclopropane-1-carboxylate deaminase/D-cysteine desulfhydrase-like pyridoxal-dependent ACC family enzyme